MTYMRQYINDENPDFKNHAINAVYWATIGDTTERERVRRTLWDGFAPVFVATAKDETICDVLVLQHDQAGYHCYIGAAGKPNDYDTSPALFDLTRNDGESLADAVFRYVRAYYHDYCEIAIAELDSDVDVYTD